MAVAVTRLPMRIWILAGSIILSFVIFFTFSADSVRYPVEFAQQKAQQYCGYQSKPSFTPVPTPDTTPTPEPTPEATRNCEDPYRRPGYLHIPKDPADYRQTQWIPFTEDYLNSEPPEYAAYPAKHELIFNDTAVEPEFLNAEGNPQQWMRMAVDENQRRNEQALVPSTRKATVDDFIDMKHDGGFGWLWGRRVVMFGDSVDRYMTTYFCNEFGIQPKFPIKDKSGRQAKVVCEIPSFNFTMVYFHSVGSFTYRPNWWWIKNIKSVAWEERWGILWKPHEASIQGPNGRPDLVLWQNGLWDQRAFWEGGTAMHNEGDKPMTKKYRQMVWEEVRFVTARIKKIANILNGQFAGAPIMFRALTVHRQSGMGDAIMMEMDRLGRAVAERAGHEMFEWARLFHLMGDLYQDGMHPGRGPASWLWGNIMLEYIARSAGAEVGGEARSPYFSGWDACHKELSGWGGR
ncbi:Ff.00g007350.m01.CDS01 [Fusarium sp. VM40]|nr:Ff.00g007350.m01.CDS01 [Fusarium sp. VM40]